MGRKKLEIKRIEDKINRQVTFSKRRSGFLKKVEQLSILCDAQIAAVIFSGQNKLYQFSHGNSLAAILERYHEVSDADGREPTGIQEPKISENVSQANSNLLQRVQRYIDELNLDSLPVADLEQLEIELESALVQTRATKITTNTQHTKETVRTLQEKEQLLRDENELLTQQIDNMVNEIRAATQMEGNREVGRELPNLANKETDQSLPKQTLRLFF